jgi:hypothetical protein
LLPAAVALFFAGLALEDAGLRAAAPYLVAAALSVLYVARPMVGLWVLPFSGFAAFTLIMLVAPLAGLGSGPMSDWLVFLALGAVPTLLLWLARPGVEA